MSNPAPLPPPLERIASGIPGLDAVTGGGFLKSGVYILQGAPGAGKTILANQIVHRHVAGGGRVVYVTMLAESHARLLQHMEAFSFFDPAAVPEKIYFVSAFNALRTDGLRGVVELLRTEMRSRRAGVVVLDGLVMAADAAVSDEALKLFVSDIQAHSTLTGCTTLLLTSEHADRPVSAEQTMVDGILLLRERAYGVRRERNLEVVKFRGSSTLRGNHSFQIGPDGIEIYPRLEAARRESPDDHVRPHPLATGIGELDAMLEIGGYAQGSITVVSGPSGCGKTSLALHFLAGAPDDEKALFVGFYETPELLARMSSLMGLDDTRMRDGRVEYLWQPFGENMLDAVASQLLRRVDECQVKRVVIDGVGGFMAMPSYGERGASFMAALLNALRRSGATTLVTAEVNDASGARSLDTPTMSSVADTVIELEIKKRGEVRRFLNIRKCRVSRCDYSVRELLLRPHGLALGPQGEPVVG